MTTFADSSMMRATCSTTWDGDHFPGARGIFQNAPTPSAVARSALVAACTPASEMSRSDVLSLSPLARLFFIPVSNKVWPTGGLP